MPLLVFRLSKEDVCCLNVVFSCAKKGQTQPNCKHAGFLFKHRVFLFKQHLLHLEVSSATASRKEVNLPPFHTDKQWLLSTAPG